MTKINLPLKAYSYFLVILQFLLIIFLGINSISSNYTMLSWGMCAFGLLLGFWAVWVTRKAKMTILPDVRKGSTLITNGPYKYIRHPMYSSVLLFCLGLLFTNYNIYGSVSFLFLFIVLSLKIRYEEERLLDNFSGYADYKEKTKKLIPFVI